MSGSNDATSDEQASLVDRVRALAEARGPHEKLPTHRELCERLGTRRFALDRALTELEERHILYRRQGSGIYVSPYLHRKRIAVLLDASFFDPLGTSPFWAMLWGLFAHEAQTRAETRNQDFTFYLVTTHAVASGADPATGGLPPVLTEAIKTDRLHGALCIGMTLESARWIEKRLPVAGFATGGLSHLVRIDHAGLVEQGVECLARRGCRRVALWLPVAVNRRSEPVTPMESVFLQARQAHGLDTDPALLHYGAAPSAHTSPPITRLTNQEQGFQIAMEVFGPGSDSTLRPDGLLIGDDLMTSGALVAFERLGIVAGRDLQMASHTNAASCVLFGRQADMDLLEIAPAEIATAALTLLDELLAGNTGISQYTVRARWKPRGEGVSPPQP